MSGIVITISLLACVLVISEACNQSATGGSTGGHTLPPSSDHNPNVYAPGSGPVPPHPFRRRREDMDSSALLRQSQAMTRMMQKLFAELDSDDDNRVCEEEWTQGKGNPKDYSQIVSGFDKNGDGLLSFEEFLAASKS